MKKKRQEDTKKKFKYEFILNKTAVEHQLTRPSKVGPTMELLYEGNPKSFEDWETYFFNNAYQKLKKSKGEKITKEFLDGVGEKLFDLLQNKIFPKIIEAQKELTIDDCREYIHHLVLKRSYEGFIAEKNVVEQVEILLNKKIIFIKDSDLESINIDAYGKDPDSKKIVGLSVKPLSYRKSDSYSKDESLQKSWEKWEKSNNAKIFIVYYKQKKGGQKKEIVDKEILIQDITDFLGS